MQNEGTGGAFANANAPHGNYQNERPKCDGKANTKSVENKINDFIGVKNHIFGLAEAQFVDANAQKFPHRCLYHHFCSVGQGNECINAAAFDEVK